jgi:nicotinate-nucleotide pyrophosphorylase (carboxylating)
MTPDEVRACVAEADAYSSSSRVRRPILEVSGGMNLQSVGDYAATGIDLISIGAITNSAPNLDIGLDISTSEVQR